jgi:hypothetical protein
LFPGVISALPMEHTISPVEDVTLSSPISYFYGHTGGQSSTSSSSAMTSSTMTSSSGSGDAKGIGNNLPLENTKLYKLLIERLAHDVHGRLASDEKGEPDDI